MGFWWRTEILNWISWHLSVWQSFLLEREKSQNNKPDWCYILLHFLIIQYYKFCFKIMIMKIILYISVLPLQNSIIHPENYYTLKTQTKQTNWTPLTQKNHAETDILESFFSHAYKIWRQNTFHAISWASALRSTQHSLDHFFPQVLQGKPIKHQKTPACHVKFTTYWNSVPYSSHTCWLGSHHEPHS